MTDTLTIKAARQEVARLVGLQEAKGAELTALRAELERLDRARGDVALAAVDSGNAKPVQAATAEVGAMRSQIETTEALLGAIGERLQQARDAQRVVVVAEMRKRAADLAAEVEKRKAERDRLCQLIADFEGPQSVMLIPGRTRTEVLSLQAERMANAADSVARGLDCPRDLETGCTFDKGLW